MADIREQFRQHAGNDAMMLRDLLAEGDLTGAEFWACMANEAAFDEDFAVRAAELWIDTLEEESARLRLNALARSYR